jgi:hypothetical protein
VLFFLGGGGGCYIDEAVGCFRTLRLILKVFNFKDNVKNILPPPVK